MEKSDLFKSSFLSSIDTPWITLSISRLARVFIVAQTGSKKEERPSIPITLTYLGALVHRSFVSGKHFNKYIK